jgi:hypothetical protein
MTTVVITMAGFGQRFRDAGYDVPKYRIVVHGRSLFAWSMLSLRSFIDAGASFVFVVRGADDARTFIDDEAQALGIQTRSVVELDAPTDGQATTAMLAGPAIAAPAEPMLVYNIDTFVHPDALPASAVRGDGWVPCFHAQGDHWSFAAADADGRVSVLKEKERISANATIGLYWFSSFNLYARSYGAFFADSGNLVRGERYIAPLYNHLIAQGRPVFIHDVPLDAVVPLGVPADVEAFRQRSPPSMES